MRTYLNLRIIQLFFCFALISVCTENSYGQSSAIIDINNLSNVRIDELSNQQIIDIYNKAQKSGVSLDQIEQYAVRRGLSPNEAMKFKDRVLSIQSMTTPNEQVIDVDPNIESSNNEKDVINRAESIFLKKGTQDLDSSALSSNIYGQDVFRKGDIKGFEKSTDAKAPSNYIIGIGDELSISVFGYSFYNETLKVDSRGAINPSQIGTIYVKGLTYDKVKSLIKSRFSQFYDFGNNSFEISLAYSRVITVNIVGEVLKPGSYKIPAINTAFNALLFANGPSNIGTLRNIEIRRNGKTVKKLDIYKFLLNPNSKEDFYLEDNDYIVVSTIKNVVNITGEINRPNNYELIDGEGLMEILKYSGGLTKNAYSEKIQIVRNTSKGGVIIDVNLDSLNRLRKNLALKNGDQVIVRKNISKVNDIVRIYGAVNYSGDYNFYKGIKLFDLINLAGGINIESDLEQAILIRTNSDLTKSFERIKISELGNSNSIQNIELYNNDFIRIFSKTDFIDSFNVRIFGAVRNPKSFDYVSGMTIGDLIKLAGGLSLEAEKLRIEVARINFFTKDYIDGQDIKINIDRLQISDYKIGEENPLSNYKLQPFDQVFIRSIPNFSYQENVELIGEVKYPGYYSLLSKDEKISNLIKRAGGLNKYAFAEGARLYRPSVANGYIVLDLKSVVNSEKSKYNYVLKAGDKISIPTITDYVSIVGSDLEYNNFTGVNQINVPYIIGRRANYYVNTFGNGFTKEAWRKKTYVVQPNAKINRTRNFYLFKIYPKVTKGSSIYVVKKIKKEEINQKQKEPFNWNKFIENSMVKLTGVATLFILFRQL